MKKIKKPIKSKTIYEIEEEFNKLVTIVLTISEDLLYRKYT